MAVQWPTTLQQLVSEANFGLNYGDTVLRSTMDVGPVKTRNRYTKRIDSFSTSIYLTTAQYTTFDNFYTTSLVNGTLAFEFNHPITQALSEFKFSGTPRISSIGGGNFTVAMTWELQP